MTTKIWAGIDIGGTKVAVALVKEDGTLIAEDTIGTEVEEGPDFTVERIAETLRRLLNEHSVSIEGIGIGSPGPIDAKNGVIQAPSNLQTWRDYPITRKIEERFHIHTVLGNDADVAGLAEYLYGLSGEHKDVVYVTVSTGVGGGIISNGNLHNGSSSTAAEFGHMIVQKDGPLCGCGRHGCLETFSSGTGIANRMMDRLLQTESHPLRTRAENETLISKEVFAAYEDGDALAREVITQAEDYLAMSLANVINIVNPSVLIMGGGVVLGQPRYFEAVKEKISQYALVENMETVDIVKASFQEKAGVLGAASLSMISSKSD